MTVEQAVSRYLEEIGEPYRSSPLAASALVLAGEMDDAGNSATSKSMCARALNETLERLAARVPEGKASVSKLDELRARRESRDVSA